MRDSKLEIGERETRGGETTEGLRGEAAQLVVYGETGKRRGETSDRPLHHSRPGTMYMVQYVEYGYVGKKTAMSVSLVSE